MRLTRIEIHGFKSFSDRTPLDLAPGLTAIVGPNGCGKSNVIDAVKWALGEQKASAMRGKEMLDVIFKGNGARPARNFAEVSLHLDNSGGELRTDYTDVVITRRLYRSGDSEYQLNKQNVRLKDIRDLLMDTGLGTGAYSIMEQGRIDAILSANALERRRIFEEAAGISRYRARRRESESKLSRTEQNLLRLGDVVEELEKRQRSLKVQAGRARSYLEARERMQELRSLHFRHQWHELGAQLAERESGLEDLEGFDAEARRVLEHTRGAVSALQDELSLAGEAVERAAEDHRVARGELEAAGERRSGLADRLAESDERREKLATRLIELDQALAERRAEAEAVEQRLAALTEETSAWQVRVDEADTHVGAAQRELSEWQAETTRLREQALEQLAQLTQARNDRAEADSRRAAIEASKERLVAQIGELDGQLEEQSAIQGELFAGARDLEATAELLGQRVGELSANRDGLAGRLRALDERLSEGREQLAAAESRREALEELVARHDGVSPGAVALLESGLPGIEGLLVDHLHAPRHLAEAVEAALGASTQAVLVADRAAGLAALAHLREVQGGRVLLVPCDTLQARPHAADGERLLDQIECNGREQQLAALLGHVRLVPDRAALEACVPDGVTVWVTPDGDLLDERGILRGGTAGNEGGLVARRAERDTLVERCARLREDVDAVGVQREQVGSELAGLDGRLEEARRELRRTESERDRTKEREQEAAVRRESLTRALDVRRTELAGMDDELTQVLERLAAARARTEELEAFEAAHRAEEERRGERARQLQSSLEGFQQVLSAARLELSARRERQQALEGERRQVQRGVDERHEQIEHLRDEDQGLAGRRDGLLQALTELAERLGALQERVAQSEAQLEGRRDGAHGLGQRLEQAQDAVRRRENEVESTSAALGSRRLEVQETRVRRDELRAKVLEDLGVDLAEEVVEPAALPAPEESDDTDAEVVDGAVVAVDGETADTDADDASVEALPVEAEVLEAEVVEEEPEPIDWDAVAEEIERLRDKLARMGNVNLAAVDELTEVEDRLGYLVTQRDDLDQARAALMDTINKVNKESRERFIETFEQIREHFKAIFRKLFRGGKADLVLEEDVDVLEAGIEISAAPPGKDSRSITLLSGGERTMTAVGMLFALFRTRPSPVCLLDEVDAALDESNIDRFCSVLEDFLGQSQFLVVTHARRTMSYADTVFGVTMQEHGVSKVLSMELEDYDRVQRGEPVDLEGTPAETGRKGEADDGESGSARRLPADEGAATPVLGEEAGAPLEAN